MLSRSEVARLNSESESRDIGTLILAGSAMDGGGRPTAGSDVMTGQLAAFLHWTQVF